MPHLDEQEIKIVEKDCDKEDDDKKGELTTQSQRAVDINKNLMVHQKKATQDFYK